MTRIGILNDTHLGITKIGALTRCFEKLAAEKPDLIIHAGDYCGAVVGNKTLRVTCELMRATFPELPILSVIGNHDCLDPETEVFTTSGWKRHHDILPNDRVVGLDHSGFAVFQSIDKVISREHSGDMVEFKNTCVNLLCTPNHRVLLKRSKTPDADVPFEFVRAENLTRGRVHLPLSGPSRNKGIDLKDADIFLSSLILTDGSLVGDSFCLWQSEHNVETFREALRKCGLSWTESVNDWSSKDWTEMTIEGKKLLKKPQTAYSLRVPASEGRAFLSRVGITNRDQPPKWAWYLSDQQFDVFLDGLIEGDGTRYKDTRATPTNAVVLYKKKDFLDTVQALCALHGHSASMHQYRTHHRLNIVKRGFCSVDMKSTPTSTKPYIGNVWCLSVPFGNFLVRRGGKCFFTGNCWSGPNPSVADFLENYRLILQAFKESAIHFLDKDGIWRQDGVTILGHSGWYHTRPTSNDWNFIPKNIEGDTHHYLQKLAYQELDATLSSLDEDDTTRVFVSHFPVLDCNPWDGNPTTGELLKNEFGVKYFISGHSHTAQNGPLHYRSNSDYYNPTYTMLRIENEPGTESSTKEPSSLLATDG